MRGRRERGRNLGQVFKDCPCVDSVGSLKSQPSLLPSLLPSLNLAGKGWGLLLQALLGEGGQWAWEGQQCPAMRSGGP